MHAKSKRRWRERDDRKSAIIVFLVAGLILISAVTAVLIVNNEKTDNKYPTGETYISIYNGGIMSSDELLEYIKTTPFSNWTWVINANVIECNDALGSLLIDDFVKELRNDQFQCQPYIGWTSTDTLATHDGHYLIIPNT